MEKIYDLGLQYTVKSFEGELITLFKRYHIDVVRYNSQYEKRPDGENVRLKFGSKVLYTNPLDSFFKDAIGKSH